MKLSDFLQPLKLIYVGGELVLQNPYIDYSTVEFYELTAENLTKIYKNVVSKTKVDDDHAKFLFDILEYVCNIEKDIAYSKFKKLVQFPTEDFMKFIQAILQIINKLFNLAETQGKFEKEAMSFQQTYSEFFPKEETLEEKILRLTKECDAEKDFLKKKPIIDKLSKLYAELEEQRNGKQ